MCVCVCSFPVPFVEELPGQRRELWLNDLLRAVASSRGFCRTSISGSMSLSARSLETGTTDDINPAFTHNKEYTIIR